MFVFDAKRTFQPLRGHVRGSAAHSLHSSAQRSLEAGDLAGAVRTPAGTTDDDWIAVHLTDFQNTVSLLFGLVVDECTPANCPTMCASSRFEYLWSPADGGAPRRVPAREYVNLLLSAVSAAVDALPPARPPPADFLAATARPLFRRLLRVYAHIYCHHLPLVAALGAQGHLDDCMRHFHAFVSAHALVDAKEAAPLADVLARLAAAPPAARGPAAAAAAAAAAADR
jgi:MOB kinase activator 1